MDKYKFSLDNFKKWMRHHTDEPKMDRISESLIGTTVESKISKRKLVEKIAVEEGEIEELAQEFSEQGGTITDADGKQLLVEVESGSFYIQKNYVRRS